MQIISICLVNGITYLQLCLIANGILPLTPMLALTATVLALATVQGADAQTAAADFIGKQTPAFQSDRMTPEALWAMGRIGSFNPSPNGREAVYSVSYYSVKQNKSHSVLYTLNLADGTSRQLTTSDMIATAPSCTADGATVAFTAQDGGIYTLSLTR